jgi:hypothetical protein
MFTSHTQTKQARFRRAQWSSESDHRDNFQASTDKILMDNIRTKFMVGYKFGIDLDSYLNLYSYFRSHFISI